MNGSTDVDDVHVVSSAVKTQSSGNGGGYGDRRDRQQQVYDGIRV
jgi:hypothetical protein